LLVDLFDLDSRQEDLIQNRTAFWSLPVFYYALIALGIIIAPLVGGISLPDASRRIIPVRRRP
jgi:hypothetical protein